MKNKLQILRDKFLKQQLTIEEEKELREIEKHLLNKTQNAIFKNRLERDRTKGDIYQEVISYINSSKNDWLLKVASVLLFLTFGTTLLYFGAGSDNLQVYENYTAERLDVLLPDSSRVILKKNSKIVLAKDFNGKDRNLKLQGQAFFDVYRNESKPFKVITNDLVTRVLGTSFNIDQRQNQVKVTVASGLVSVAEGNSKVVLGPDQQAIYNIENRSLTTVNTNHNFDTFWFKNKIELNNITFGQFTTFLENHYSISFHYMDEESKNKKLSIHISKDDTLESILRTINYINEVKLEKTKNNVIEISLINK